MINKIKEYIKNPFNIVIFLQNRCKFCILPDSLYLKFKYKLILGKDLNLNNPKTFTEKIQCLKIHDRNSEYTTMVDKYEAKKYVANKIGNKYIIPTIGVWNNFEEIDFDTLPNQFVLKCTHDSGGLVICENRSKFDINYARQKINNCLKKNYYYSSREWPYKNVNPRIIAEEYLENSDNGYEVKMNTPLISVVIPLYNVDTYMMKECIDSLVVQSVSNFEVIIINDCSSDTNLINSIDEYIKDKPQFQFYHNEVNRGVSYSRNRGIELAKGDYILFVDSDDFVENNLIEELSKIIYSSNADTVFFEYNIYVNNNKIANYRNINSNCKQLDQEMVKKIVLSYKFNSPCTILYSKNILTSYNVKFDTTIKNGEDLLFNMQYLTLYKNGVYLKKAFYNYRNNLNSVTHTFSKKQLIDRGVCYFRLIDFITDYYHGSDKESLFEMYYTVKITQLFRKLIDAYDNLDKIEFCSVFDMDWIRDISVKKVNGFYANVVKTIISNKYYFVFYCLSVLRKIKKQFFK